MSETLFLRRSVTGVEWLLFDQFGSKKDTGDSSLEDFNELFDASFSGSAIYVVPGEDVLLTFANVPSRQYRQIVQAVPYVVEEQLAMDVEDCFFALGERNDQGEILVNVCDLERIESWVGFLSSVQIDVTTMVSETSLVHADDIDCVCDGGRVHVKWRSGVGLTVPANQLPLALSTSSAEQSIVVTGNETALDALGLQLTELEAMDHEIERNTIEESGFYLLCRQFDGSETNLLQGAFKVEVKRSSSQMIWRSVAILTGVALMLHLLLLAGQGYFLSSKADEYQVATQALYKSVFPNDRNVRDVRRRWNSHLGRTSSNGGEFIALFGNATQGLQSAGLTLQNVNFNESRGDLILQVLADRSETLVQYTQQLSSSGLSAEIGTISQEGDSVRGSIKIKASGDAS